MTLRSILPLKQSSSVVNGCTFKGYT
ncbi:protein of unknown function [Methanoculleus bourgensis]|uniref:Uncharacterized protein n=1 Tax=Methanoculleus bourgensis TaxID=83986 RepID=A0A0X3BPP1_9EURY|nr:protein of unknown function [Methanoculleus bourgensis]